MQIEEITNDLMNMLELKLLNHVPTGEFNKNDLARNIMNNLLDNLFMKSLSELKQTSEFNVLSSKEVIKESLKNTALFMDKEPKSIEKAFESFLKEHQDEEIFDESLKMGQYLIGALPLLIEEYVHTNEFFLSN